jgi:hypothetical protein
MSLPPQEQPMTVPTTDRPAKQSPVATRACAALHAPPAPSGDPSVAPALVAAWMLEHEDAAAYDAIHAGISDAVKPADFLEQIWVRDVIDLVWEVLRLRQLKGALMDAAAPHALQKVLASFVPYGRACEIAAGWAARDAACVRQAKGLLAQSGFSMAHVMAEALADRIEAVERIDKMIASAEARRGAMLREVERHRAVLASRLRMATDEVVDAEFVAAGPPLGRQQ